LTLPQPRRLLSVAFGHRRASVVEIVPHIGIGQVRLGMSPEEADRLREPGMRLDYAGNPLAVAFIEVTDAFYRDIDLCFDPADEVLASLVELERLDPAAYPPGRHEYRFPHLSMTLWRGEVSDEPGDQGYTFQAVSIYQPGYYQQ
jgi:hypothetical protein